MSRINWKHIEAFIILFLLCLSLLLRCSSPADQPKNQEQGAALSASRSADTFSGAGAPVPSSEASQAPAAPDSPDASEQFSAPESPDASQPSAAPGTPDAPQPSGADPAAIPGSASEEPDAPQPSGADPAAVPDSAPEEPTPEGPGISSIVLGDHEIPFDAEVVDISYTDVKALDIDMNRVFRKLPNLKAIYMIGCGLSNDEYAALQDSHPEIRIIWEIVLSHWTIRTDQVAFSTQKSTTDTFYLEDSEAYFLRYCRDLVALDIGHNHVSDLSFLQYMPNLKILILVDNFNYLDAEGKTHYISDLSWLRFCPKLRYLECFYNFDIKDYSFLLYLPYLEDLNISYTGAGSIDYLLNLPYLQRLWMEHTYISYDDYIKLTTYYPWAQIVYFGEGSVDQGWRDPGTHHEIVRDMFDNNYVAEYYQD